MVWQPHDDQAIWGGTLFCHNYICNNSSLGTQPLLCLWWGVTVPRVLVQQVCIVSVLVITPAACMFECVQDSRKNTLLNVSACRCRGTHSERGEAKWRRCLFMLTLLSYHSSCVAFLFLSSSLHSTPGLPSLVPVSPAERPMVYQLTAPSITLCHYFSTYRKPCFHTHTHTHPVLAGRCREEHQKVAFLLWNMHTLFFVVVALTHFQTPQATWLRTLCVCESPMRVRAGVIEALCFLFCNPHMSSHNKHLTGGFRNSRVPQPLSEMALEQMFSSKRSSPSVLQTPMFPADPVERGLLVKILKPKLHVAGEMFPLW